MKTLRRIKTWVKTVLIENNHKKIGLFKKIHAIKHNFSSDFYDLYKLDRHNINNYISEYERYLTREINHQYHIILDDKILFTEIFGKYIAVPKILAIKPDDFIYSSDGKNIKTIELLNILKNKKSVIKPINYGGGHGVYVLEIKNNTFYINYEKVSKETFIHFLDKQKKYIINEFIQQSGYANKIFPKTVNTIRIITIIDPKTGDFIIPCAVHRFGNNNTKGVDNASSGGYITEIKINTGELGYTKKISNLTPLENHPDTGEQIKGVIIPNWNNIKNNLIKLAKRFPYLPFIAWDVVVSNTSITIIEANASSSLELFQIFGTIKDKKLGEFYKHHKIIK